MASQMTASELLFEIQKKQLDHDEFYHREIARLPMPHRLQHMALHLSKYFARLVANHHRSDATLRLWTDAFIISVSTCNTLNRKLEDLWGLPEYSPMAAAELRQWIDIAFEASVPQTARISYLAKHVEQICNATEKMDHIEEFPYRSCIGTSAAMIAGAAAAEIQRSGDLFDIVATRLDGVKAKSIFHEA
ncbi:hypothetical protein [Hyphomonas sp.]|uniref:hypothetical protein n=1 Tax=Hyphomonas sp. TaxID=87 RepID=UPI0025BEC878|nr:hypothetical protein [Hyphomonas sp.]